MKRTAIAVAFPEAGDSVSHVNEAIEIGIDGVQRYTLSPALRDVFAPDRVRVMQGFLVNGAILVHSN
jgi:hypothetical protein